MKITRDWLQKRYVEDLASVEQIALEAGCGMPNVRRYLKVWKILRGFRFKEGKPAWNSGLTKEDDERIANVAEQRKGEGNPMFGVKAWNAGLTKEGDERVAQIALKLADREVGEETREKMGAAKRGKGGPESNAWRGGTQYSNGYGVNRISMSGRRIYAHRHIAEVALQRVLSSVEEVHHVDRDKMNNEPLNLIVLFEKDHNLLHRAIEDGWITLEQQIEWLTSHQIHFERLIDEDIERKAA